MSEKPEKPDDELMRRQMLSLLALLVRMYPKETIKALLKTGIDIREVMHQNIA